MDEDIKILLKSISKRIEKLTLEELNKNGFTSKTSRIKLLSELIIEQVDINHIKSEGPLKT